MIRCTKGPSNPEKYTCLLPKENHYQIRCCKCEAEFIINGDYVRIGRDSRESCNSAPCPYCRHNMMTVYEDVKNLILVKDIYETSTHPKDPVGI